MHANPPSSLRLPSPRRRRYWPWAVAGLLLLGATHALAWAWLAGRMEAELAGWVAARRALGWQVQHGIPQRGGWPWAAQLTLPGMRLREPGGLGWQAERLSLRLALPWPRGLDLSAQGQQALLAGQANLPFLAASLTGTLPLAGYPMRFQAEALRPTAAAPPTLRRASLVLPEDNAFDLVLEGLALPGAAPPLTQALGPEVQRLAVQATLTVPLPPASNPAQQAAAWRDAGGRLNLHALALQWGPVQADLQGELALDAALQPAGQLALTLAGLREALAALATAGAIEPGNARSLQLLGTMLQRSPPEGGPPSLRLPLVLRDRTLAVAGFTLLRLPPMAWPAQ